VKADGHQPARHGLSGCGKRLLALALAKIELGRRGDCDLDHTIGQLARNHFIEPDSIEAWMMAAHLLKNSLPERRLENGRFD
jgi:hypothetical protein